MMLRYLEPQCQAIAENGHEEAFSQEEPFLAVYCPCKEGYFNKAELDLLERSTAAILSEHLLNISVAYNASTACACSSLRDSSMSPNSPGLSPRPDSSTRGPWPAR